MTPKLRWNLIRIVPFGIIWLVTGLVFVFSDKLALGDATPPEGAINPNASVIFFASFAVFMVGLLVGTLEVLFVNRWFRKKSLLKTIAYKFLFYVALFTVMIGLIYPVAATIELETNLSDRAVWDKYWQFWGSDAYWSTGLQLTFSLLLCLVYGAVSEHLGHSIVLNFLTGKYHRPKQEERIFLFLDMYDSTTIAEELGNVHYFEFLQRYYDDLANAIIQNRGEVYQYIGDEIVITWPKGKGLPNMNCIRCFFDMKADLEAKHRKYIADFGFTPKFKGGMHMGTVTTGEVGALKKEIVFTGDVLNTAARIQGLCKEVNQEFLISNGLYAQLTFTKEFNASALGAFNLRGKQADIEIYAIAEQG